MEEWRDIPETNGKYQASNYGRIRSTRFYGKERYRILNPGKNANGYYKVTLVLDGNIHIQKLFHRLVAITFIPNPDNLEMVNHKDENVTNNHIDNLEWCTRSYNQLYSIKLHPERKKLFGNNFLDKKTGENTSPFTKKGIAHTDHKKVVQKDLFGNIIQIFDSCASAAYNLETSSSHITACCKRNKRTDKARKRNYKSRHKGFIWEYLDSEVAE